MRTAAATLAGGCIPWLLCGAVALHAADDHAPVELYPKTHAEDPGLPSPHELPTGAVTVTAQLADGRFAVVPVTLDERQRTVDGEDFPALARTGLHTELQLRDTRVITGRSIAEITVLGRPGALSTAGFMAADEDVISVLLVDNRLVARLDLTHPRLAAPLFQVVNLLETDIGIVYRNHSWDGLKSFRFNDREIFIRAKGTKGGQKSIFDDGIEGALDIDLWRQPDARELEFLRREYKRLSEEQLSELIERLFRIHTGEMEPRYIMCYGFYEGHTEYRTDPLTVAIVLGLRSIEAIAAAFPAELPETLTLHFTRERVMEEATP